MCFCPVGFIVERFRSPTLVFRHLCWPKSLPKHLRTPQRSGERISRCRTLAGMNMTGGHAVVASGPSWSTGAARLAARGVLRAGAGLVTIASPREALAINAMANLAVMVRPVDGADELIQFLSNRRLNAFAIGPGVGVGEATCALVLAALAGKRAVVLDADAITSFADKPHGSQRRSSGATGIPRS